MDHQAKQCKHCLKYAQHCVILSRGVGATYSQRGCVFLPVSMALKGGRAELSVFACFGTSLHRLKSLSLTPTAPQRQRLFGKSTVGATKRLRTAKQKGQNVYIIFKKGGAEIAFPPDWPNLTVIDVHPWQPGSQSAKSNRKSSEGA